MKTLCLTFFCGMFLFFSGIFLSNDVMIGTGLLSLVIANCTMIIFEKIEGKNND